MKRNVTKFKRVCEMRLQRINVGKSKIMVFEDSEQTIDFAKPYS